MWVLESRRDQRSSEATEAISCFKFGLDHCVMFASQTRLPHSLRLVRKDWVWVIAMDAYMDVGVRIETGSEIERSD